MQRQLLFFLLLLAAVPPEIRAQSSAVVTSISENNTTGTSSKRILKGQASTNKKTSRPPAQTDQGSITICFVQSMQSEKVTDQFGLMATRSEIYPGNIITGQNFTGGAYNHLESELNPVTLTIRNAMVKEGEKSSRVIDTPDETTLATAPLEMVRNTLTEDIPANLSVESSEVFSTSDVQMNMNIHADGFLGSMDISNKLSMNKKSSQKTIMISFIQRYYTVSAKLPPTATLFKDGTKTTDSMLYIRSVTYGRRGVLLVTVDTTGSSLSDSLQAHFTGLGDISTDMQYLKSDQLKKTNITGYIFGGKASEAAAIFEDRDPDVVIDKFHKFIAEGATFSTSNYGLPIEYEVAFVNGGALAAIEYNINETKKVCEKGSKLLRVKLDCIKAERADDGSGDNEVEVYGLIGVYLDAPDAKVSRPQRFGDESNSFNTKNGKAADRFIYYPTGGKKAINGSDDQYKQALWAVTRSEAKPVKTGKKIPGPNKTLDFLFDPSIAAQAYLLVNLDERDPDDESDDRWEGGDGDVTMIPLAGLSGKVTKTVTIRDGASSGSIMKVNFTLEVLNAGALPTP